MLAVVPHQGDLAFARQDLSLDANYIFVYGGKFEVREGAGHTNDSISRMHAWAVASRYT